MTKPPTHTIRRSSGRLGVIILVPLLMMLQGCGDVGRSSNRGASIPRDAFLATMVDLRLSAYRANNEGVLTEGDREEVLARNGVSDDDMTGFVEIHGRNIPFMDSLWTDIESHVRAGLEAQRAENP